MALVASARASGLGHTHIYIHCDGLVLVVSLPLRSSRVRPISSLKTPLNWSALTSSRAATHRNLTGFFNRMHAGSSSWSSAALDQPEKVGAHALTGRIYRTWPLARRHGFRTSLRSRCTSALQARGCSECKQCAACSARGTARDIQSKNRRASVASFSTHSLTSPLASLAVQPTSRVSESRKWECSRNPMSGTVMSCLLPLYSTIRPVYCRVHASRTPRASRDHRGAFGCPANCRSSQ